jgi:hypothetical protein
MLLPQAGIMPLCNGMVLKTAPPQGGIVMCGESRHNGVPEYIPAGY